MQHSKEIKRQVAKVLISTKSSDLPEGNKTAAWRETGVDRKTVTGWLKTKTFKEILADVHREILDAASTPLHAGDKTTVEKIVEAQGKLATRMLDEADLIPIEKVPGAIKDLTHTSQVLQGLPTDIVEHLSDLGEEEILRLLKEAESESVTAGQYGESSHRPEAVN